MNLRSILTSTLLCGALFAQSAAPSNQTKTNAVPGSSQTTNASPAQSAKQAKAVPVHQHYRPERFAGRAGTYYRLVWGIDGLSVKSAEAGEVIRFTYTVLDADKAKMLNDKKVEPSLIDEQAHVKLVVPQMDKVGKLRQSAPPEAGKTYWMLFSNKGGYVKRGHKVNVVIGRFRADGLVVD
jgi:glucose/arabinose dehydrogenase